jgi:hypothetical protein
MTAASHRRGVAVERGSRAGNEGCMGRVVPDRRGVETDPPVTEVDRDHPLDEGSPGRPRVMALLRG